MRFYVVVGLVFLTVAILILLAFGASSRTLADILIVAGALLPVVIRRTPRLYLGLSKLRFALMNTPATWDLDVRFRHIRGDSTPRALAESLIRWAGHGSSKVTEAQDRVVVKLMGRFVIEIHRPAVVEGLTPESLEEPEVSLSVLPVNVGYRDSRRFLEHELLPTLEKACNELGATWASYALSIDLPEKNPFYGLYLQQFNLEMVRDFKIEFVVPTRNQESRVVVAKHQLTVLSDSIEGFRSAVSAALAFRVPEAGPCR